MVDIKEFIKTFKVPQALIKKILPPKKSISTVDTSGNGKADSIQIKILNVVQPFKIPEDLGLGNINIDEIDPSAYAKLLLDGETLDISKGSGNVDVIKNSLKIHHKGDTFSFEDILSNKLGGRTIAMGDSISVLLKLEEIYLDKLTEGKHVLKLDSDKLPKVEINFELNDKNMNVKL